MAHVLKGSQFYLHIPRSSVNANVNAIPAFFFPAEAGPHLPTQGEGWKAELARDWFLHKIKVLHNISGCYNCSFA